MSTLMVLAGTLAYRLIFLMALNFSNRFWAALLTIDYGQTISYAKLATLIDKPKAFRACANANGKIL